MVFNQSDLQHPWFQMYDTGLNPMYNATASHACGVLRAGGMEICTMINPSVSGTTAIK